MARDGSGSQIAAQSLFTAASAANAIPVAGQFVSAGLAIAGLFTKIFGGRRRRKKAEEARRREQERLTEHNARKGAMHQGPSSGATVGSGAQPGQTISKTIQSSAPDSASFNTWGGGQAPSVHQQVLNNKLGL